MSLVALGCACMSALIGFVATGQAVGLIPKTTATPTVYMTVRSVEVIPVTETSSVGQPTTSPPAPTQAVTPTAQPSATRPLATQTRPVPTSTSAPPTVALPTDTAVPPVILDTATAPPPLPTETAPVALGSRVVIIAVDKREEYVDIQNLGDQAQDLSGWRLVSEKGNQSCSLAGSLAPGAVLRIWAMTGDGGYSCGNGSEIWNNSQSDPAVLYNDQGQEVSRQ